MSAPVKLLTIDDEKAIRKGIAAYFDDLGYSVFEAEDGRSGMAVFMAERPDVVLCDLRMPEIDGLEVLRRITAASPETPVIVVSGTGAIEDSIEALRCGAWDYITKPILEMAELEHVVNKTMERAALLRENRRYREFLEEEVKKRTAELELAKEAADCANRVKNEFLSTMSHELRTPLNAVIVLSDVLKRDLAGAQLGMAAQINESGHKLLGLVNDILEFSKMASSKLTLNVSAVDVREEIDFCVANAKKRGNVANINFNVVVGEDVHTFRLDSSKFRQILSNLIGNAIKFMPEGGPVTISARYKDAERKVIEVVVEDAGIGISEESVERLFTPFQQLDGSLSRSFEGIGLGLVIVKRLIELHEGSIRVESEVGVGSRFIATLPAAK